MKSYARWSGGLLVTVLILLGSVGLASARGRNGFRHAPPPPKPVYTAIAAVDRSAMTISTTPKNSTGTTTKTYRFTAKTKIDVNGQPGTLADLKPGQRVRVGLGASDDVAEELSVTSPPAGAGKDKAKAGRRHTRS